MVSYNGCIVIFWAMVCVYHVVDMAFAQKVVLNGFVCDRFIPRLIGVVVPIIWTKTKMLSIMLRLVYDHVKLHYDLVVCSTLNLIE